MVKVLVISENRRFVKNICNSFLEYKEISLELVYHSTNAFNKFISVKPDIVIIHSQIMIPVQSLLAELEQCKWPYQVLIFGTITDYEKWNDLDIAFLEDEDICRLGEIAQSYKEKSSEIPDIEEQNNYKREEYIIKPELYYVILSKYMGEDIVVNNENQVYLKQCMETVGIPEIFTVCGQDLIIVLKKSDLRVSNGLIKIHEMICHCINPDYASIYAEKVYWNQVNEKCGQLLNFVGYTYFFCGECKSLETLIKRIGISSYFQENQKKINSLLIYTLEKKWEKVKELLKQLYLHDIKEGFDYNLLFSVRDGLQFCEFLFSSLQSREERVIEWEGLSIEDEFSKILSYFTKTFNEVSLIKNSSMVISALIYALEHFQEELSLERMAEILCISKMHLSRLFKSQTNMTFLEFLQSFRIFAAKQYLLEDFYKINEISEKIGYADAHYFAKIFRRYVGCSPKEFRIKHTRRNEYESIGQRL